MSFYARKCRLKQASRKWFAGITIYSWKNIFDSVCRSPRMKLNSQRQVQVLYCSQRVTFRTFPCTWFVRNEIYQIPKTVITLWSWLRMKLWEKVESWSLIALHWQKLFIQDSCQMPIYSKPTKQFIPVSHNSRSSQLLKGISEACNKCIYVWQLVFNDH